MFTPLSVVLAILLYVGFLILIAWWVERTGPIGKKWANNPFVYSLSLAIYCTSWTYYGSVGKAAGSGMLFLSIYLGPTLGILLWWTLLRKLVRIKNNYHITSIADFISARYNKSQPLAAIATLLAVLGVIPYVALQLKAVLTTFALVTVPGSMSSDWIGRNLGAFIVGSMIVFTVAFGVRRLSPGERHAGMVMALAVECAVKLVMFLAVGIFVTYGLHAGFDDLFQRVAASPFRDLLSLGGKSVSPYLTWTSFTVLSMSAILFLPRQFHIAVVENSDENHIRTAMWLFPLYMLLICLFVLPIALGGLLLGLPASDADAFVLLLPLQFGSPWLAMLTFIGGFSAATGMIMVSAMTLSVMITNHLLLPLLEGVRRLAFLRQYLLQCRWVAVAGVLLAGYLFERQAGNSYTLVAFGMISFAAVFQFAPAILGGIFWRRANQAGALLGLSAGFLIWFYTALVPSFVKSGWLAETLLKDGPWGLGWLRPEHLLGLGGFDPISHTVFWSLLGNVGLYVFGSLCFQQSREEQELAEGFVGALGDEVLPSRQIQGERRIDLGDKQRMLEDLLGQYFSREKAAALVQECLHAGGLGDTRWIHVGELVALYSAAEKHLAGAIGAASAREAMKRGMILTAAESRELSEVYAQILSDLSISPDELRRKINFYQEREALLTGHAGELEEKIRERDLQIAERQRAEEALKQAQDDLVRKEKLSILGQLAGTVGHELRNPLGVMNNAVYFLQMVSAEADATTREYLGIIKKEIDNSQRILTDLLDFARTKAPQIKAVAPRPLVEESLGRCFCPDAVQVRIEVAETLPLLRVDPSQLGQVLQNLMTNAIQAMPEGGVLRVGAHPVEGGRAGGLAAPSVRIAVADTGGGISADGLRRLFQPLFTTKPKGIGLGLVVCKNLTEANGGRIEVESLEGEGTIFTLVLPACVAEPRGEAESP